MQFTATIVAAILAVGASAAAVSPANPPTFGKGQCIMIADKAQTIRTDDCKAAVAQLRELAAKEGSAHACTRNLVQGKYDYLTVRTCKVQTDGNGIQHCTLASVVADGLEKLVKKCGNQWGYMDTSRIPVKGDSAATEISVAEVETDGPVVTPWDKKL